MSKINVQKADSDRFPPDAIEEIRKKAFELFERRGGEPGKELDDWFEAEQELFWIPQAVLAETDFEFKIEADVPGLNAQDIQVTAGPSVILVQSHTDEYGEKSLYCRIEFAAPIDVDRVTAKVEYGTLTIVAPKKSAAKKEKKEEGKGVAIAA